jgi:hypothetical protein
MENIQQTDRKLQFVKVKPKSVPSKRRLDIEHNRREQNVRQDAGRDFNGRQQTSEFHYDIFDTVRIQGIWQLPTFVQVCSTFPVGDGPAKLLPLPTSRTSRRRSVRHQVS